MILQDGRGKVKVGNSNWPLLIDLMVKKGFDEEELQKGKEDDKVKIDVNSLNDFLGELSAWGIPWRRI